MDSNSTSMAITWVGIALVWVIQIYSFLIIAAAILSWVQPDPRNVIVRYIYGATEPVVRGVRRLLPFMSTGSIDFSPIVVLLLLQLLQRVIVKLFEQIAISTIR